MRLAVVADRVTVLDRLVEAGPMEPLLLLRLQMAAVEAAKEPLMEPAQEPGDRGVMEVRGAEALEAEALSELPVLMALLGAAEVEVEKPATSITDVGMVDQEIPAVPERDIAPVKLEALALVVLYG